MKQKKKSPFFTFVFSFLPGGAEMYMGFMKNGFSLMAVFILSLGLINMLDAEFIGAVSILVWFFGFFHARHVASMDDELFYTMEDIYIWEEFMEDKPISEKTARTWLAAFIILIGFGAIWSFVTDIIYRFIPDAYWTMIYPIIDGIPQFAVAVVMIAIGAKLLKGKKQEMNIAGYIEQSEE